MVLDGLGNPTASLVPRVRTAVQGTTTSIGRRTSVPNWQVHTTDCTFPVVHKEGTKGCQRSKPTGPTQPNGPKPSPSNNKRTDEKCLWAALPFPCSPPQGHQSASRFTSHHDDSQSGWLSRNNPSPCASTWVGLPSSRYLLPTSLIKLIRIPTEPFISPTRLLHWHQLLAAAASSRQQNAESDYFPCTMACSGTCARHTACVTCSQLQVQGQQVPRVVPGTSIRGRRCRVQSAECRGSPANQGSPLQLATPSRLPTRSRPLWPIQSRRVAGPGLACLGLPVTITEYHHVPTY